MQQSERTWGNPETQVVVVSFESPDLLTTLAKQFPDDWYFVPDPDRSVYEAYGAGQASTAARFSLPTIWSYVRAFLSGRSLGFGVRGNGTVPDTAQLGGDFVIGPDGRATLAWRSRTPADRPAIVRLAEALAEALAATSPR